MLTLLQGAPSTLTSRLEPAWLDGAALELAEA
jgi:hypothetical protein